MVWLDLIRRYGLAALLIVAVVFAIGGIGYKIADDGWTARWAQRDADDALATAFAEQAARAKEQADQAAMNKVQADATQRLQAAQTDASSANSAADRLREQVAKLLAADSAARKAGTGAGRPPAENPGNMLAVVLDKSIERSRQLAAFADSAMIAAQGCQAAWDGAR